jgi:ADP-heptose:LPS heptosyltransferase
LELLFHLLFRTNKKTLNICTQNLNKTILLYEPRGLGDALSICISSKYLRDKDPRLKIIAVVNNRWKIFISELNYFDEVIGITVPWADKISFALFVKKIRIIKSILLKKNIIKCYEFRGDIRDQLVLNYFGICSIYSWDHRLYSNINNFGLLTLKSFKIKHIYNRPLLNVLLCSELKISGSELKKYVYKSQIKNIKNILIHLSAGWKYRLWNINKWEQLIIRILENTKLIITVTSFENDSNYLFLKNQINSININYKLSNTLNALKNNIVYNDLFVGIDSGPMHLAALFNKPIVALFGPGNKTLWSPNIDNKIIIDNQDKFDCAPCIQKKCKYPLRNCMDSITVSQVYSAVMKMCRIE